MNGEKESATCILDVRAALNHTSFTCTTATARTVGEVLLTVSEVLLTVGEVLSCESEAHNVHDGYAVAMKMTATRSPDRWTCTVVVLIIRCEQFSKFHFRCHRGLRKYLRTNISLFTV